MDLHVAVESVLALAARQAQGCVQAVGQVGDEGVEALCDGGEVSFVVADEGGVGLGGQSFGQVEGAGGGTDHVGLRRVR